MAKKLAFVLCSLCVFCMFGCAHKKLVQYKIDKPLPAFLTLCETSGMIQIKVVFRATDTFEKAMNRKKDRNISTQLCNEALRRYFNIEKGQMEYSQMNQTQPAIYDKKNVEFNYQLPRDAVQIKSE